MSAESIGQLVGVGILVLIGVLVYVSTRGKSLTLLPSEFVVAQIWAETKQISWSGFVAVGNQYTGKLMLTNQRLIYTNPTMQKVGFALTTNEIKSALKGAKGPMMILELTYVTPKGKTKRADFMQLGAVPGQKIDPTKELPIGMFIDKLTAWREGRASA